MVWALRRVSDSVCFPPKTRPATTSKWCSGFRFASTSHPARTSTIVWSPACPSSPRCGSSERGPGWRFLRTRLPPQVREQSMADRFTVTIATFMEALDSSIANVALPHIAGSLSATADQATWVLTSYLVSNGIILPLGAWLSDVMGRKRFYMICVALFTVCSFLCGIAPSLGMLILFRVLQGVGGGGLAAQRAGHPRRYLPT